jgi:hypothetical protein
MGEPSLDSPLYDPFKRFDQYGETGDKPQSRLEYLRLGLLAVTVLPLKIAGCFACIVAAFLVCRCVVRGAASFVLFIS